MIGLLCWVFALLLMFRGSSGNNTGVPDCIVPSDTESCHEGDPIGGSLSLDCSGTDYIVTFKTDYLLSSLSLFANCSSPCGDGENTIYYYDTTQVNVAQLRAMNTTINGTSGLGMPSTLGSACIVFGCYYSSEGGYDNFPAASCSQALLPVTTHLLDTVAPSSESPPTNLTSSINDSVNTPDNSSTEASSSSAASISGSSTSLRYNTTPPSESLNSALTRVGIPTIVALLILAVVVALILVLGLCHHHQHHKNKSSTAQLHYGEEIFHTSDPNDEFKVYEEGMKIYYLAPAFSQVSVFDSFYRLTADPEKPAILKTELEHSYSVSSDYFAAGDNSSRGYMETGILEKRDLSDTSSAGGESELTEDMTQEEDDVAESNTETSQEYKNTFNSLSLRTPSCNTPVGSGNTSDYSEATTSTHVLQDAEQQIRPSYIHSSSQEAGAFETNLTNKMHPVLTTGYVSNTGSNIHSTNEQRSVSLTASHSNSVLHLSSQTSSGPDHPTRTKDADIVTDRTLDTAVPHFTDSNSPEAIRATSLLLVSHVGRPKAIGESCSNITSQALPDLSHQTMSRTALNSYCTSDYVTNASETPPVSSTTGLRSHYLQDRIQLRQNSLDEHVILSSNFTNCPSLEPHASLHERNGPELNVRLRSSLQKMAGKLNGSDYITSGCSDSSAYVSDMSTATSDSRYTMSSSGYFSSSKESSVLLAAGNNQFEEEAGNNQFEEDNKSNVTFVEEYSSSEDEDAEDCIKNASNLGCSASTCRLDWDNRTKPKSFHSLQTSGHISINFDPIDNFSEGTKDLEVFVDEGRDNCSFEDQTMTLRNERIHSDGYFSGGLSTDSIQFDFPYQQAGLSGSIEMVRLPLADQNLKYPVHLTDCAVADVTGTVFSYSDLSSAFSGDFQDSAPDLVSPKMPRFVLPGKSTAALGTSTDENLNIINFNFDS